MHGTCSTALFLIVRATTALQTTCSDSSTFATATALQLVVLLLFLMPGWLQLLMQTKVVM
jgi:hypothetical protein